MSDEDSIPTESTARLKYSITNLWDEFANVDNLVTGTLLNVAIGLPGLAGWLIVDHWIGLLGLGWFLIHVSAIVQGWIEA